MRFFSCFVFRFTCFGSRVSFVGCRVSLERLLVQQDFCAQQPEAVRHFKIIHIDGKEPKKIIKQL